MRQIELESLKFKGLQKDLKIHTKLNISATKLQALDKYEDTSSVRGSKALHKQEPTRVDQPPDAMTADKPLTYSADSNKHYSVNQPEVMVADKPLICSSTPAADSNKHYSVNLDMGYVG